MSRQARPEDSLRVVFKGRVLGEVQLDAEGAEELFPGHVLRDIDRLATDTLMRAARRKLKKVDRQLVQSTLDADPID